MHLPDNLALIGSVRFSNYLKSKILKKKRKTSDILRRDNQIWRKIGIGRFLESLITNLKSKIQHAGGEF